MCRAFAQPVATASAAAVKRAASAGRSAPRLSEPRSSRRAPAGVPGRITGAYWIAGDDRDAVQNSARRRRRTRDRREVTWATMRRSCEPDYKITVDKSTRSGVKQQISTFIRANYPHKRSIMYAEERQQAIASLVISQGRASVAELARDLRRHHRDGPPGPRRPGPAGLVRRVHGGAVPVRALRLVEPGVGERETTRAEHKDAIAAAADRFFPLSGASVLLDAGTTTSRIAAAAAARPRAGRRHQLGAHRGAAGRACRRSRCSCSADGCAALTQAAVGEQALRVLDTLRVDIAFIGTNGISVRHGLSTPDSEEAAVKRAMVALRQLRRGRRRLIEGGPRGLRQLRAASSSVDALITDPEISAADRAAADRAGHRSRLCRRPHDRHRHPQPEHRPHGHAARRRSPAARCTGSRR